MIDDQGLVYANPAKTELIGVVPNFAGNDFSGGFANVVIPASVKAITGYVNVTKTGTGNQTTTNKENHGAFEGMTSLTNVTFASNNVTRIGAQAFKGCSNLATISLPSSVSYIGNSAFEACNKLNAINLQNVSYIGDNAFKNAFKDIPTSSVELNVDKANYVGANAFESTSGLKTINFNNNTVLQTVSANAFLNSGITSLDLSQATKLLTIGNEAFKGCSSLTEVKVPKSLTSFGSNVFGNVSGNNSTATTSLTTIDLSSTQVTQLPNSLFQGCSSLSNVKLPAGLTEIGQRAFYNSGLTTINLSDTALTTIKEGSFANTANLTNLTVPKTLNDLQSDNTGSDNVVKATFSGSGITSLDLSQTTIQKVAASIFNGAEKLATVKLPSTVTRIEQYAFKGTTALKTLTQEAPATSETPAPAPGRAAGTNQLASTLTNIQQYAFAGTGLESIDLSVTGITGADSTSDGSQTAGHLGRGVF